MKHFIAVDPVNFLKTVIFCAILLCCSCSTTEVTVYKTVIVWGDNNFIEVTGSDLKGNQAQQSSAFDWILEIPFLK